MFAVEKLLLILQIFLYLSTVRFSHTLYWLQLSVLIDFPWLIRRKLCTMASLTVNTNILIRLILILYSLPTHV
jgi:hypothetical protein